MSGFLSFSDNKDLTFNQNAKETAAMLVIFLASGMIFFAALFYATPTDLFSTSLWYDSNVPNLVFSETSGLFARLRRSLPVDVSLEATVFSVILWLAQMIFGIKAALAGTWVNGRAKDISLFTFIYRFTKGEIRSEDVNWDKVNNFTIMFILSIFDTFTDTEWKAGTATGHMGKMFVLSYLYNNMGSEWALVEGFKLAYSAGASLLNKRGNSKPNSYQGNSNPNNNQGSSKTQKGNQGGKQENRQNTSRVRQRPDPPTFT